MTISGIILLVSVILLLLIVANLLDKERNKKRDEDKITEMPKISIRESMDLVNLPIVTFLCNGIKLNFLIDTGSDESYLNKSIVDKLPHTKTGKKIETIGKEGIPSVSEMIKTSLNYKDTEFSNIFASMDLDAAFKYIKDNSGIQIHGILGCKFFDKYKYIINFKELVIYI